MVDPPSVKPTTARPGRPRKSFEDKSRSAKHDEALEIKEKVSGHDFQAVLLAAGLMAKDQGYRDLSFVLRRLAQHDPPPPTTNRVIPRFPLVNKWQRSSLDPDPDTAVYSGSDLDPNLANINGPFIRRS